MLKRLWEGWKRVAKKIARFNSMVLCTVLYFVVLPFVAIPFRLSMDPLRLQGDASFTKRGPAGATMDEPPGRDRECIAHTRDWLLLSRCLRGDFA